MAKTISLHNGTEWSRGHNIRDERFTKEQYHIDPKLTRNNVVIVDKPIRQAYKDLFGKATEEYNSRQQRSDRKIDDYYRKIKKDKRKHLVYELIVQIGNREDTGNNATLECEALRKYAETWDKRNPNLTLVGAYIHADEPNGTVHMHIDYIPVARCDRGMRLQNSLDRAIVQQGFKGYGKRDTPQIAWQRAERKVLEEICIDMGIDAALDQKRSEGRKHLSKNEYIAASRQIEEKLTPIKDELQRYIDLRIEVNDVPSGKEKGFFKKTVELQKEDYDRLIEQAKAYTANRSEINNLRKRQKDFEIYKNQTEKELDGYNKKLEKRNRNVTFKESELNRRKKQLDNMITEQLQLNERYDTLKKDKNDTERNLNAFRNVLSMIGLIPDQLLETVLSGKYDALGVCQYAQDKIQKQIDYLIELKKISIELKQKGLQLDYTKAPKSIEDRIKWAKEKADNWNAERDYYDKDNYEISR